MIEIKNLSVSFGENAPKVLRDMNMTIEDKDKIAIIGETGSGKSILLLAILGLLPESAKIEGEIYYKGKELLSLKRKDWDSIRGREIAYVPQGSGAGLNPLIRVGEQVSEPLRIHFQYPKDKSIKESIALLSRFNIGDEEKRAYQYPHTFSGGMKQRAMIAMGISAGADIVLADEPTKGLDNRRIEMVENCFKLLEDKTYVCVTHDLNFAKSVGDKISVMYDSMQLEYAGAEELFNNPYHPYTIDIINAMPENGLKNPGKFFDVSSAPKEGCRYRHICRYAFERCKEVPPMIEKENGRKVRCFRCLNS